MCHGRTTRTRSACAQIACSDAQPCPGLSNNRRRLPPTSGPRQAPPWYRAPISTQAPTVLVMDGPRRLVLARRDRDRAGSGGKRAPDPEAEVVVPVVGGVPVAVGRAEVLWIVVPGTAADDTATRGRPGFKAIGRIKPATPEDRVAQAPRICMLSVSDPCPHARFDITEPDRSCPPLIAEAAQAIAKASHVVLGEATATVGVQLKAEKLRRLGARQDHGLARVKLEPTAGEVPLNPQPPVRQYGGIIVEQREIIHVTHVGCPQYFGHEMIEAIEIKVREELAGQVADRQTAAALHR